MKARDIERMSFKGTDGVLEATGYEVILVHAHKHICLFWKEGQSQAYKHILAVCVSLYKANLNSDNTKLMSAMLCAALYPNVVQVSIHNTFST